jgi:hypothetical protein
MPKRQRCDTIQTIPSIKCGLLKIWQIPGLLKLTYCFLMEKIDYEQIGTNDSSIYFNLREICKQCKHWSHQCDSFLSPNIRSIELLEKWTTIIPKLQSMKIPNQTWVISLLHLRSLCILDQPRKMEKATFSTLEV